MCVEALALRTISILRNVLPHSPQSDPASGPGGIKNTKKVFAVKKRHSAEKKHVVNTAAPVKEVCAALTLHLLLPLSAD